MRIKNFYKIEFQDGTELIIKDKKIKTMTAAIDYAKRVRPGRGNIVYFERF